MQRKRLADYKPNSVLRLLRNEAAIIHLGFESPRSSSGLPGNRTGRPTAPEGALFPYLALLHVGFTKPARYRAAGALLPHLFTLTSCLAVCFLWHFPSLTGPRVRRHIALWSSDFPLPCGSDRPSASPIPKEYIPMIACGPAKSANPAAGPSGTPILHLSLDERIEGAPREENTDMDFRISSRTPFAGVRHKRRRRRPDDRSRSGERVSDAFVRF